MEYWENISNRFSKISAVEALEIQKYTEELILVYLRNIMLLYIGPLRSVLLIKPLAADNKLVCVCRF